MEYLDVINENDEVIRKASRKEVYENELMHRIVHVLAFNEKGEMALQLRSRHVNFCPGYWVTSAGGHVRSGESYEEAALREFEEELGARAEIELMYKDLYVYDRDVQRAGPKLLATFRSSCSGPFSPNPREVERVEFFSIEKIQEMVNSGEKIHPELMFLLKKHFGIKA